jgi:hypothetical protein
VIHDYRNYNIKVRQEPIARDLKQLRAAHGDQAALLFLWMRGF